MGGMTKVMQGDFSHRIPNGREVMLAKMVPLMDPNCVFKSSVAAKDTEVDLWQEKTGAELIVNTWADVRHAPRPHSVGVTLS